MAKTRNISLPDEIMERMEKEAKALGLNCSAYISMTLSQKWQQDETIKAIPRLLDAFEQAKALQMNQVELNQ